MKKSNKIQLAELVYCCYFAIMLFAKGIGLYEGMTSYNICLLLGTGLVALKLLLTRYTFAEMTYIGLLLLLGGVIYLTNGERGALIYILMIVGLKNVSVQRVFKVGLVLWAGTFFGQIIVSLLHAKPDIFYIHEKLGAYIIRWSLGYPHPNVLHISYFILLAFLLYFMKKNHGSMWKILLISFLGNVYIFLYSMSYTGFLLTTIFLFLYAYLTQRKRLSRLEAVLIQAVVPCCVVFSVFGPVLIRGRLFEFFNKILNSRFYLSRYFLTTQKISLFGTREFQLPDSSYALDCSYVSALFYYGIIFLILMTIGLTVLVHYLLKNNRRTELAIVLGIAIAGISEPFLVNTSYKNIAFLFLGEMVFVFLNKMRAEGKSVFWTKGFGFAGVLGDYGVTTHRDGSGLERLGIRMADTFVKRKKLLLIIAVCGAVLIGGWYHMTAHVPDKVYALLWSCERKDDTGREYDEQYVYLDKEHLPEDFDGLILNYNGPEEPLYDFGGFTVQFEYLRRSISYGMIGGFCIFMAGYVICFVYQYICDIIRRNKTGRQQV